MITFEELMTFILGIGVLIFALIKIRLLYIEEQRDYEAWQKINNIDTQKRIKKMNRKVNNVRKR